MGESAEVFFQTTWQGKNNWPIRGATLTKVSLHQGWKWAFKKLCCCVGWRLELCQFRPVSFSPRVTSTRVNFKFDPLPYIWLEELLSNTRLNFSLFPGWAPGTILTLGNKPSIDLIHHSSTYFFWHKSTLFYFAIFSLIERCCAPAYKGDTKDDTSKLSIFLHRDHSVSASESH